MAASLDNRARAGRFALEVSAELREHIERRFVATAPTDARERVRSEALSEAENAEVELTSDGWFVSRALGVELFRTALPSAAADGSITFLKAAAEPVTLRFLDDDTLLALQPGRPNAIFRRLRDS
jgi:hypothetical protein